MSSDQASSEWLFDGQLFGEIYAAQKGVFIICECVAFAGEERYSFGTVYIDLLGKSLFVLDSLPARGIRVVINGQCTWRRSICSHYIREGDLAAKPKLESTEF